MNTQPRMVTLDEVSKTADEIIRHKVKRLIRSQKVRRDDFDDVAQELWLDVFRRWPQFDAARSSPATFITRVVEHEVSAILRRRARDNRLVSLNKQLCDSDEDAGQLGDTVGSNVHDFRLGRVTRSQYDRVDLESDVETVLNSLPDSLRSVCELRATNPVVAVVRKTGISRSQLYRIIGQLRRRLEETGLRHYV